MTIINPLFLILLISLSSAATAEVTYYPIPETPQQTAPAGYLERYIDLEGHLTLHEVMQAPFETIEGFHSRRYSGQVEWYRFGLREQWDGQERLLEFGSPYLNRIDVYLLREGQASHQAEHYRFGDHVPMSQRPTNTRSYTLPLALNKGERITVYARVVSNSAMTFHAVLWNRPEFELHDAQLVIAHGAYFGLVGGLVLLFMPLAILFRRKEFMAFAVLGIAQLLLNIGSYGYTRVIAPEAPQWLSDLFTGVGALGIVVGSGLVFITVLNLRQLSRWLYRLTLVTVWAATVGMLFVTTDIYRYFAQNILFFNQFLMFPLTLLAVYHAWRSREAAMILYATGFVITVSGGLVVMLAIAGVIPSGEWSLAAYQISTVFQMILLAVGLGLEWWQSVREKNLLKERAVLAESRSELLQNLTRFLSHELITPLAAAKRAVEVVERQQDGINTANRKRLIRAKERLTDIGETAQVFLGREGRGEITAKSGFTVEQLVERSLEMMAEMQHGCRVTYEIDRGTVIRGSQSLLAHALRNLIDNALRHGGKGDCWVVATRVNDRPAVRVIDEGPGLDAATVARLNQGQGASTGEVSGLMLVKFFLELQGGALLFENSRGSGLMATLILPSGV